MIYAVVFAPKAKEMLVEIRDKRIQAKILDTVERLRTDPEKQGKPLVGPFMGYRSLRAIGQRYRIVYRVEKERVLVIILGVGLRKEGDKKDIYRRLQKLLHMKLL